MSSTMPCLDVPVLTPSRILPFIREEDGTTLGDFFGTHLASAFQPIFSVAHRRAVGFEALARMHRADGTPLPPREVFGERREETENVFLDRLCRMVHAKNFVRQADDNSWLFLNVDPYVTAHGRVHGEFFAQMLESCGLPPHRVVVEILESEVQDERLLVDAAAYYRDLGCLVAIDDFGAGHSNFERIWRIQPHIVKLDRSIVTEAVTNPKVRRIAPNLVGLIHEAGSLVLMEGIETEEEAMTAMESDIDFVQGYYFGMPSPSVAGYRDATPRLDALCTQHKASSKKINARRRGKLHSYEDAFEVFVKQFRAGADPVVACHGFLELPDAERCYVLDKDGRQVGESHLAPHYTLKSDSRFEPVRDSSNATWARRDYFRQALGSPGEIQVSRPYLSIAGGNMCVTLSAAVFQGKEMVVLCADLRWND